LARAIGLSAAAYDDLEAYDDGAYMSISLEQLRSLGRLLDVSPRSLVAPAQVITSGDELSPAELVGRIREHLKLQALSTEQFEERVGWAVSSVMRNPDTLWRAWNVDALHDICAPLGVVWPLVLPTCAA